MFLFCFCLKTGDPLRTNVHCTTFYANKFVLLLDSQALNTKALFTQVYICPKSTVEFNSNVWYCFLYEKSVCAIWGAVCKSTKCL